MDRRHSVRKRDRLRQLRAFSRAARLGSMARAAEHLGLSPPAVALQVRELEHELDAVLFDRGGGGVTMTAAGERFHALAGPLVDAMDALLEDFVDRIEDDVSGCVDIGASGPGTAIVLPRYVKRLRERYPGVRLRVRNSTLGEGLAHLDAGVVEFVLGARETLEGHALEYHEMLRYDIVLITSRNHPLAGRETVTPQEAAKWPAVVPPAGSHSRQFGESAARELGIDVKAVLEVGGWGGDQALRGARDRDLRGAEHLPARDRRGVGDSVRGANSGAELRRVHAACQNAVGARTGFSWAADTGDCAIDWHAVAGWGSASDTGAREVMKQRRSTSALEVAVVARPLPATTTFVAGRRCGDFCDSSAVRTCAQSRAELESLARGYLSIAAANFLLRH